MTKAKDKKPEKEVLYLIEPDPYGQESYIAFDSAMALREYLDENDNGSDEDIDVLVVEVVKKTRAYPRRETTWEVLV